MQFFNTLKKIVATAVLTVVLVMSSTTPATAAQITNLSELNEARVSFTFDDGFLSTYTLAAPILEARNIDGTLYLTSGFVDAGVTDDDNLPAMSWAQAVSLQNDYGWEIAGHTQTHAELPTLTQAQIAEQFANSNTSYAANGLQVTNLATPFGAYDNVVITEAMKVYNSHRGFADRDALNSSPYNRAVLQVQSVEEGVSVAQVQAWVDQAIANKQWLILVFHDVAAQQNPNYVYTTTTADPAAMADYVQSKGSQIKAVTVEDAAMVPGVNVLQNAGFVDGFATWTTDNATQIALDTNNNGNFPNAANSAKVTGGASAAHLFSGLTPVANTSSYILDVFVNALSLTAGELGFYVDEYDTNGTWVSGQWLGNVTNGTIGFFTRLYNATSNLVNSVRVQTYLTAGSTGTAYVDNVNLRNLDGTPAPSITPTVAVTVTPTPSTGVTPTATPAATNMIANGGFENGLSNGWTTDNAAQVAANDQAIRMNGSANAAHLFYGLIAVDPLVQYAFSAFADATALTTGEAGFYIDEYDTAGTWISGRWLGKVTNGLASTFSAVYQATSATVAQIRVQTYLTANATGNVTVDNYSLVNPNGTTPTVTPSATPSGTITPTVTVTPTVTPTATPSGTVTPTPSVSVTPVPTTTGAPTNLIDNNSFDNGFTGWTNDNAANVAVDANNNGGAPTSQNSAGITGNASAAHLFYSLLPVDPAAQYLFDAFVNATALTSGELGFYMDEYDANGLWISGQWFGKVTNGVASTFSKTYKATSAAVTQIRIQTYVTANSVGKAYVDNYSLVKQGTGTTPTPTVAPTVVPTGTVTTTPTPTVTGTPSVTPTPTTGAGPNLVPNNSFEDLVSGWAISWTRDSNDFIIDASSNGNNGTNSLHILSNTAYAHTFSSMITVDPTKTYTWSQYVTTLTGTGEFGFYIDEYTASDTWVSGQWKGMISGASTGTKSFTYTPTSANVAKVRLQYYVVPNSTFNLYLDSVSLSN